MKKILINMALLSVGILTSCNGYLDKEVDLSLSDKQVFQKYENTRGYLANIYTYLPDAFRGYLDGQYLAASRDCMTDNATSWWPVHRYHSIQSDGYNAKTHWFATEYWTNDWKAIRACNQFLRNADEVVVGNKEIAGDDDNKLYTRWMAEARLMRAFYHFDLVGWFGGIPIEGDDESGTPIVYDAGNPESMNNPRLSAAEVLKWVADECDAVKDVLPFRYANEDANWGRVNGAVAYALKSRALLYRASPLNNTNNDASWWTEAANAALDFIKKNDVQSNPYKLYSTGNPQKDYYNCFVSTPHLNNEYILSRSEWNTREIETFLTPCGFTGTVDAVGRTNPTQNLVDSYETINGLPIDKDPAYNDQDPYANRDPRLEQTIIHHGTQWGLNEEARAVDVSYPNGKDYKATHGGTYTGYYTKKFLNNMAFTNPTTFVHACPIYRYAEVLLNAAEALNEAGRTDEAYQYVDQVRSRVGMPSWKSQGLSKEQFRERIQNERRVEFCFEDHRFFDERRWKLFDGKTASSEKNQPRYRQVYNLYGVQVTPEASTVYNYVSEPNHPTRAFNIPKNYLFPIPDSETKMLSNLKQNAGWEMSDNAEAESTEPTSATDNTSTGE